MKTDRELLELAARAAGIEWFGIHGDDQCDCLYFDIGKRDVVPWNPLTDDGDALRLAAKLDIQMKFRTLVVHAFVGDAYSSEHIVDGDKLSAARRAIVRAAAAIGEGMK